MSGAPGVAYQPLFPFVSVLFVDSEKKPQRRVTPIRTA